MAVRASAGHVPQSMVNSKPATIKLPFHIFFTFLESKRMEKRMCARVGKTIIPNRNEHSNANVLVNANGRNSFPSAASIAKTGRKLTTVVASAVVTAGETSEVAFRISSY